MRIQELSISERIVLAQKLWDSVVDEGAPIELSKTQAVELDRRLQEFLDDQDIGSSWSEIKGRITNKA